MIRILTNYHGTMLVSCGESRRSHRILEAWKLFASTQLPAPIPPRGQALLVLEEPAGQADGAGLVCVPL